VHSRAYKKALREAEAARQPPEVAKAAAKKAGAEAAEQWDREQRAA